MIRQEQLIRHLFVDCYIKPQLGHKQISLINKQDIQLEVKMIW